MMELLPLILICLIATPLLTLWEVYNNCYFVSAHKFIPMAVVRILGMPLLFLVVQAGASAVYIESVANGLILVAGLGLSYQLFAHLIHNQAGRYHSEAHHRARIVALMAFAMLIAVLPTALTTAEIVTAIISYAIIPSFFTAFVSFMTRR